MQVTLTLVLGFWVFVFLSQQNNAFLDRAASQPLPFHFSRAFYLILSVFYKQAKPTQVKPQPQTFFLAFSFSSSKNLGFEGSSVPEPS